MRKQNPKGSAKPQESTRYRDGKPLCNAKSNTCGAFAMKGKQKCYNHGGASTGAPIKHGLYSKYLPKDLAGAYEEHRQNSELFDLTQDVAVISAMAMAELEGARDGAPSIEQWEKAKQLYHAAVFGQDPESLKTLGKVLDDGHAHAQKIARAAKLIEQRTKTIEKKQKLELESERNLTVAQAMAFTSSLAQGAKQVVYDHDIPEKEKVSICRGIALFIARSMRRSLGPGLDAGLAGGLSG